MFIATNFDHTTHNFQLDPAHIGHVNLDQFSPSFTEVRYSGRLPMAYTEATITVYNDANSAYAELTVLGNNGKQYFPLYISEDEVAAIVDDVCNACDAEPSTLRDVLDDVDRLDPDDMIRFLQTFRVAIEELLD